MTKQSIGFNLSKELKKQIKEHMQKVKGTRKKITQSRWATQALKTALSQSPESIKKINNARYLRYMEETYGTENVKIALLELEQILKNVKKNNLT